MDTGVIVKMLLKSICGIDELRLNMFWQQFVNQKRYGIFPQFYGIH